jgi:hypothetical protein
MPFARSPQLLKAASKFPLEKGGRRDQNSSLEKLEISLTLPFNLLLTHTP